MELTDDSSKEELHVTEAREELRQRAWRDKLRPEDRDDCTETTGRMPYWMRPLVALVREERESLGIKPADYGVTWHAAFRDITGPSPKCAPGDRAAARLFLYRVRQAIDRGLDERGLWTPSDWGTLHRLERLWERRADGLDPRFEVMGTAVGNPCKELRDRINTLQTLIGLGRAL